MSVLTSSLPVVMREVPVDLDRRILLATLMGANASDVAAAVRVPLSEVKGSLHGSYRRLGVASRVELMSRLLQFALADELPADRQWAQLIASILK